MARRDMKVAVEVSDAAQHDVAAMQRHVASAAQRAFSDRVQRPANYAQLLSQVWAMAQDLIEQVRLTDEPLARKVAMIRDLTKLLPALDKAESRHRVHIGKRVVQDMTSQDLEAAVKEILRRKQAGQG